MNVNRRLEFVYTRYRCPMPTCDVLDCANFSVTTVAAPSVEGGQLHICDSHLTDLELGATYTVDVQARKIVLHYES
jgi:hypothetical protein